MSDYISYKMIPSVLKIEKGDVVLLTSDITDLFLQCQDNGEILDVNILLDHFKKLLEKRGPFSSPPITGASAKASPLIIRKPLVKLVL